MGKSDSDPDPLESVQLIETTKNKIDKLIIPPSCMSNRVHTSFNLFYPVLCRFESSILLSETSYNRDYE